LILASLSTISMSHMQEYNIGRNRQ